MVSPARLESHKDIKVGIESDSYWTKKAYR